MAFYDWVAKKIMENIQKMKIVDIIKVVKKKDMCEISINKTYWARRMALRRMNVKYKE